MPAIALRFLMKPVSGGWVTWETGAVLSTMKSIRLTWSVVPLDKLPTMTPLELRALSRARLLMKYCWSEIQSAVKNV